MSSDLLKEVVPGQLLSAEQQNLLIRAVKQADSGPNVFRNANGAQHRKFTSPREMFVAKIIGGDPTAGYEWEETEFDENGVPSTKQGGRNSTDLKVAFEHSDASVDTSGTVYVNMLEATDDKGLPYWGFQAGGAEQTYPAKIVDICSSAGGVYWLEVYVGQLTITPADCLAPDDFPLDLPSGMTQQTIWVDEETGTPLRLLGIHTKENGLMTHWLKVGSWTTGVIRMSVNGFPIFVIADGYARAIGGPTIDSGNVDLAATSTAGADSWLRDFIPAQAGDANQRGDDPVQIYELTRIYNNPGSSGNCEAFPPSLNFGLRLHQYDAQGHLAGVGAESQLVIQGCCPPQTSLASPSFATEADATYARALSAQVITNNLIG